MLRSNRICRSINLLNLLPVASLRKDVSKCLKPFCVEKRSFDLEDVADNNFFTRRWLSGGVSPSDCATAWLISSGEINHAGLANLANAQFSLSWCTSPSLFRVWRVSFCHEGNRMVNFTGDPLWRRDKLKKYVCTTFFQVYRRVRQANDLVNYDINWKTVPSSRIS